MNLYARVDLSDNLVLQLEATSDCSINNTTKNNPAIMYG